MLSITSAIAVAGALIAAGLFKGNICAPSYNSEMYVGSSTTIKIGCYDSFYIKNIIISNSSTSTASDRALIYKTVQKNLKYRTQILKDKHFEGKNSTIAINYNFGDIPIYVAHHGNLTYEVRAQNLSKSSHCSLQFYLFNKHEYYKNFKQNGVPLHAIATSGCLYANDTGRNFTFYFSLDSSGFYFVGANLVNVEMNATVSGTLAEFNTSELSEEECSLHDKCTIPITTSKIPSTSTVCVLVKLVEVDYCKVKISEIRVQWNAGSVSSFSIMIGFLMIIFVSTFIICLYIRPKYTQNDTKKGMEPSRRFSELL